MCHIVPGACPAHSHVAVRGNDNSAVPHHTEGCSLLNKHKQSHLQKRGYFCFSGIQPVTSHEEESICKVLNKPLGSAVER
ncbi:unnamed protein product [Bubo scandiacus]